MENRNCPREVYFRKYLKGGASKHSALYRVLDAVVSQINFGTGADIDKCVDAAFHAESVEAVSMLPFEAKAEAERMTKFLRRYDVYERAAQGTVIAKDLCGSVPFAGETRTVRCHCLMDRGGRVEAIRFRLNAPEYSYAGRSAKTRPEGSEELLLLQRLGEAEAESRGITKPVYGALYHLKAKGDTGANLAAVFEEKRGRNIITHHFDTEQAQVLENESVKADLMKTCESSNCRDCRYMTLCQFPTEKRTLIDAPPVELKRIDEIKLTPAQRSLIDFTQGECRVNAVAGSGKTTVVAMRTLALLESGVEPEKILMITFTDKAREEMRLRMRSFAEGKIMEGVPVCIDRVAVETFNSWGQRILEEHYAALGFTKAPALIEGVEKRDIIISLLDKTAMLPVDYRNPFLSFGRATGAVIQMEKVIDTLKAAHAQTEEDAGNALPSAMAGSAAELLAFYEAYNRELVARNAIDYEDQLRLLLQLKDMGIFEKMQYEHIVVDEFQDSNPNQIGIIVKLRRRCKSVQSLVVVGDELQAIYGFRNATPDNLVSFSDYFPNMKDVDMTENFRSDQPIITLANKIVERISRLRKMIIAYRTGSGVLPCVMEIDDPKKEIALFTRQVKKLIETDHAAPSSIAILCRTRAELVAQKEALEEANIPCKMKVPEVIGDSPYVKAILAFAALLRNKADTESCALFLRGLGASLNDAAEMAMNGAAESFTEVMEDCDSDAEEIEVFFETLTPIAEDYIAAAFIEKLKNLHFQTLGELCDYCIKYRDYEIRETCSTAREDTDCVSLITIHSAKGLEWDTVLLSLKKFPIDEESRRLFYVGLTRAKKRLLITYTQKQQVLANLFAA